MEMLKRNICPKDIMTKEAFYNALTMDMALGCSTNSMLHLPAIAHEAGVELNVDIANGISAKTPNLCHLAPAGPTYMEDLNEAGGVYAVMKELAEITYGELPIQIGYCNGHNCMLNALEYHRSSEVNVAATDAVLMLGSQQDITKDLLMTRQRWKRFWFLPAWRWRFMPPRCTMRPAVLTVRASR